jgi:hypothetical protein
MMPCEKKDNCGGYEAKYCDEVERPIPVGGFACFEKLPDNHQKAGASGSNSTTLLGAKRAGVMQGIGWAYAHLKDEFDNAIDPYESDIQEAVKRAIIDLEL